MALRGDYAAGYRALRRILALGEARGYEPDTSQARFLSALLTCWFEPIENGVQAAQRAREGLIAGGDLANAGYTYHTTVSGLLDCAPSLDVYVAEVEAGWPSCGVPAANRPASGSTATGGWPVCCAAKAPPQPVRRSPSTGTPTTRWRCSTRTSHHAIAAAIFGDPVGLARHTAAAMPLLPAVPGLYPTAVAQLLRGLALAGQARAGRR